MKRVTTIYKLTGGAWYIISCVWAPQQKKKERRTICFNHLSCVRGDIGSDMSVPHLFYICPAIVITVTLAHPPPPRHKVPPRLFGCCVWACMGYMRLHATISHQRRWCSFTSENLPPIHHVQCCPPPSLLPKNRYSTTSFSRQTN
jgi:hypothetical protein